MRVRLVERYAVLMTRQNTKIQKVYPPNSLEQPCLFSCFLIAKIVPSHCKCFLAYVISHLVLWISIRVLYFHCLLSPHVYFSVPHKFWGFWPRLELCPRPLAQSSTCDTHRCRKWFEFRQYWMISENYAQSCETLYLALNCESHMRAKFVTQQTLMELPNVLFD